MYNGKTHLTPKSKKKKEKKRKGFYDGDDLMIVDELIYDHLN